MSIAGPPVRLNSHKLDVQAMGSIAAGFNVDGCAGVCVDSALGHIWVSARQDANSTSKPHKLLEFYWDKSLNYGKGAWAVEVYDQPWVLTRTSAWGIRDLAAGSGATRRFIYGSCERTATGNTVYAFDVTKATTGNTKRSKGFTASANWRTTGVHGSIKTIRALAFHAARGTMFTADFGSEVSEFRKDGTQVQSHKPSRNFGTYGMAYDPLRQTILATGQSGSGHPGPANAMVCYEFDPRIPGHGVAKETGTIFLSADPKIPASRQGGFSGGCHLHIERRKVKTAKSGVFNTIDVPVLTWLAQATSDTIVQQYGRVQHYPYLPTGAAFPGNTGGEAGIAGDAPYIGNTGFTVTLRRSAAPTALLVLSGRAQSANFLPLGAVLIDPDALSGFTLVGPAVVIGGTAQLRLPIPRSSKLVGEPAFFQWLELSPRGAMSTGVGFRVWN